jgi:hypothetical protein
MAPIIIFFGKESTLKKNNEAVKAQKAKDKAVIVKACINGSITQKQASSLLGISERQVRRLVAGVRANGPEFLVHKSLGKPSNHRLPDDVKEKALELFKKKYKDMGPTLASEMLLERDGISINHEN